MEIEYPYVYQEAECMSASVAAWLLAHVCPTSVMKWYMWTVMYTRQAAGSAGRGHAAEGLLIQAVRS